jgi:hypothetical protein
MVRLIGPAHSDHASGTLNGSLTFSKWKGRHYARTCVTPKNPKAAKQIGVRVMMRYLSQLWKNLGAPAKATWTALATSRAISGFNAFVSVNMAAWQTFVFPNPQYNVAPATTGLDVTTQTVAGGVGVATVSVTPSDDTDIAAVAVFRGTTGFVPNWTNCVALLPVSTNDPVLFTDSPLTAGSYYYRSAIVTTDGVVGVIHAEALATVT